VVNQKQLARALMRADLLERMTCSSMWCS